MAEAKNVLGGPLELCSKDPLTGFFRAGNCATGSSDRGTHVVCSQVTEAFLTFTRSIGNDLSTPSPASNFPGLKPGDYWCLCVRRWLENECPSDWSPIKNELDDLFGTVGSKNNHQFQGMSSRETLW